MILKTEKVIKDWADYNGHLNVAFYVRIFDIAADVMLDNFNMGGKYPKQKLTLLLWDSDEHKFIKGTQFYEGKTIKVLGTIQTYRDKPQIVIREPEQIEVLE